MNYGVRDRETLGAKDTACVDACPVDCIHPRKDESDLARTAAVHQPATLAFTYVRSTPANG